MDGLSTVFDVAQVAVADRSAAAIERESPARMTETTSCAPTELPMGNRT